MSLSTQTQRFERAIAQALDVEVWLAHDDLRPIGYGSFGPDRLDEQAINGYELYALYLHPQFWRQGIGRRLHDHLMHRLVDRGGKRLTLWVLEINARARGFYEALGWVASGQSREIPLGAHHQARILRYGRTVS
jgi:GNAT superfamily N-acetyltransferase